MRRNLKVNFGTDSQEFEHFVGRKPTKKEMDEWVNLMTKGVRSQLDWDIICRCTAEEF